MGAAAAAMEWDNGNIIYYALPVICENAATCCDMGYIQVERSM